MSSPDDISPLGSTPEESLSAESPNIGHQSSSRERGVTRPPIPLPNPSIDGRLQLVVEGKRFAPKDAYEILKIIVHGHYDGPYSSWTRVSPLTKERWWNLFTKRCRWSEPDEVVRKVFDHVGSTHLKNILQKAHDSDKQPTWIKKEYWEELKIYWKSPEFLRKSEMAKANREVAKKKGLPSYTGGSVCITEHKKRLREELGKEPTPKETFTRCHQRKKDGVWTGAQGQVIVDKYDSLIDQATQGVDTSKNLDLVYKHHAWIEATGGVKRCRVFGMGSEAHTMLKNAKYNMNDGPLDSAHQNGGHSTDELREELMAHISLLRTDFDEKVKEVETSLCKKVQQVETGVEDQVQELKEFVETKTCDINDRIDGLVDKKTLEETMIRMFKTFLAK